MNIDTALHYLQSDLRHCLENPTEEAKAELLAAVDGLLSDGFQVDPYESGRWWSLKLLSSVRMFAERPCKSSYSQLVRMSRQYWDLVNKGLLIPQAITRQLVFDGKMSWWPQELEDRTIGLINNPNSIKLKDFVKRLGEYLEIKQKETA